jgi:hypothetical protein
MTICVHYLVRDGIAGIKTSLTYQHLAKCLSLDHTYRAAAKATVTDSSGSATKLMKGGMASVLNEKSDIIAWVRQCL